MSNSYIITLAYFDVYTSPFLECVKQQNVKSINISSYMSKKNSYYHRTIFSTSYFS